MNENCLFFTPFNYMRYEEDQIIIISRGKNPFDTPFKPMKYEEKEFTI